MVDTVRDAFGDPWRVEEVRPTAHGWPVYLGRPILPGGGHPRQGRAVVPTAELRDHLARTVEHPYAVNLPVARAVVKRLRNLLGLTWRDHRREWWEERAEELAELVGTEFARRHGVSEAAVSVAHRSMYGPRLRPKGWWREGESALLLRSALPRAYVAHRLGISVGAVGRLRWVLQGDARRLAVLARVE